MLGYVQIYTPKAKADIRQYIETNLAKYGVGSFTENVLTCVDELVKNAVKANYKYVLIRETLEEKFKEALGRGEPGLGGVASMTDLLNDRELYDKFAEEYTDLEGISARVRKALTQESKIINLKTKAGRESRKYTEQEIVQILECKDLIDIQNKVKKYKVRVQIRMNEFWGSLNIEIMNNAPILKRDLDRIHAKRREFKSYADRGEEMNFFIENMDNADGGAGLGYATIDSGLRDMDMDPFDVISIISVTNTTILMGFKLDKLSELAKRENEAPAPPV